MIYTNFRNGTTGGVSIVIWVAALVAVALVAAIAITLLLLPRSDDGRDIGGVITYQSSQGDVTVRANGERVETRYVTPAEQAETSIDGVWVAPDETVVAFATGASEPSDEQKAVLGLFVERMAREYERKSL